jgi:hypothetical protein
LFATIVTAHGIDTYTRKRDERDNGYFVERARARRNVEPAPLLETRAMRAAAGGRRTRRDNGGGGGATTRYAIASRISLRMTRRTPDQHASISQTLL